MLYWFSTPYPKGTNALSFPTFSKQPIRVNKLFKEKIYNKKLISTVSKLKLIQQTQKSMHLEFKRRKSHWPDNQNFLGKISKLSGKTKTQWKLRESRPNGTVSTLILGAESEIYWRFQSRPLWNKALGSRNKFFFRIILLIFSLNKRGSRKRWHVAERSVHWEVNIRIRGREVAMRSDQFLGGDWPVYMLGSKNATRGAGPTR